jgi:hypothetical protein
LNQVIGKRHKSMPAGDARGQSNWPREYSKHANTGAIVAILLVWFCLGRGCCQGRPLNDDNDDGVVFLFLFCD